MSRPPDPRFVLPSTRKRDTLVAVACVLAILGFIALGVLTMKSRQGSPSANQLSGIVVAKHFSGEKEREITYGRKGLKARETDSGYSLSVKVKDRAEPYELPVGKDLYDLRKVGDRQDFIRPRSEQQ